MNKAAATRKRKVGRLKVVKDALQEQKSNEKWCGNRSDYVDFQVSEEGA